MGDRSKQTQRDPGSPCALCGRVVPLLSRHHLVPRSYHHNRRIRRQYDLSSLQAGVVLLCPACHKQLHALLNEKQLAFEYNNLQALREYKPMQDFLHWIASKPADFVPSTQVSHSKMKR